MDKIETLVNTTETIVNTDTNRVEHINVVRKLSEIDERDSLNADDFRLERIIDSGNVQQLKEIPRISLSSLTMTDSMSRGFEILETIHSQIQEN